MFDFFDTSKLLIIGLVALVVIPPKDLPSVLRQLGQAVGKLRRMAAEFQGQFNEALKDAEMDSIKKDLQAMTDSATAAVSMPLDIGTDLSGTDHSIAAPPVMSDLPDNVAAPHPVAEPAPALQPAAAVEPSITEPAPKPAKRKPAKAKAESAETAAPETATPKAAARRIAAAKPEKPASTAAKRKAATTSVKQAAAGEEQAAAGQKNV